MEWIKNTLLLYYFQRFKAFRDYSITLRRFNILVGPNNAGKSTILGAFRILAEAMRKARSRNPSIVPGPSGNSWGYRVELEGIPVATENIFFDYNKSRPATIRFRISNGNELVLFFPRSEVLVIFTATPKLRQLGLHHSSLVNTMCRLALFPS